MTEKAKETPERTQRSLEEEHGPILYLALVDCLSCKQLPGYAKPSMAADDVNCSLAFRYSQPGCLFEQVSDEKDKHIA